MLLFYSSAVAAGFADCPRTYDTVEVVDAAKSAEEAFKKVDAAGFRSGRQAVEARLVCSKDILSPAAIAQIHRVEALGAFLDKQATRVPQAVAGMFAAEPGHQVPTLLLPDGHPIRAQIPVAMMALRDDPGALMPVPGSGWIESDGAAAPRAPVQRASVLQQIDSQGQVVTTHYRWPDEVGFDWVVPMESGDAVADISTAKPPVERKAASPWAHRAPLLVLSGASLVTSGLMYALAADGRAEFDGSPTLDGDALDAERAAYESELQALQAETNGLSYGFYGFLGVGVALGAVAVITW